MQLECETFLLAAGSTYNEVVKRSGRLRISTSGAIKACSVIGITEGFPLFINESTNYLDVKKGSILRIINRDVSVNVYLSYEGKGK